MGVFEDLKNAGKKDPAARSAEEEKAFLCGQFSNPANAGIHYETTGSEIHETFGDGPDYLVCGVGTGGTISGAGAFLKERNKNLRLIAVEPAASPVLSGGGSKGFIKSRT